MQRVQAVTKQLVPQSCTSDIPSNEQSPLDVERSRASFDVKQLTYFLDGNQSITELKQTINQLIENDAELVDQDLSQTFDQSTDHLRARTQQRVHHVVEMVRTQITMAKDDGLSSEDQTDEQAAVQTAKQSVEQSTTQSTKQSRAGQGGDFESAFYATLGSIDPSWSIKVGVHWGLFAGSIQSNCPTNKLSVDRSGAIVKSNNQSNNHSANQLIPLDQAVREMRIIGCFAMTELGHGSNVSGIETTMIYDPDLPVNQSTNQTTNQSISRSDNEPVKYLVVNSPTLTSTKWWIGGVASTATHAAVYARLLIPDNTSNSQSHNQSKKYRDCGVHCVLVQLRSLIDGSLMPNIQVGDMGGKQGRNGLDNGWIRFNQTIVPSINLLNKHFELSVKQSINQSTNKSIKEVIYQPPAHRELTLGALIGTRVDLVVACSTDTMRAAVIGARYACVRKQGANHQSNNPDNQTIIQTNNKASIYQSHERLIIDYVSHRNRVLPAISTAFAQHFTARECLKLLHQFNQSNNPSDNQSNTQSIKHALSSLHATCAGMKSQCTWQTQSTLESIKQSTGGLGYSVHSGLPGLVSDWAVMVSWEGDNTILALQCAKYLLRQRALNNQSRKQSTNQSINQSNSQSTSQSHDDPMYYLTIPQLSFSSTSNKPTSTQSFENPAYQLFCLQSSLLHELDRLLSTSQSINQSTNQSINQTIKQILDAHAVECVNIALLHCHMFQVACFHEAVRSAPTSIQPILCLLSHLHWSSNLQSANQSINQSSFMSLAKSGCFGSSLSEINQRHQQSIDWHCSLLSQVRDQCIPITDSFNMPDFVVGSPLGRFDGRVYEHMFERVKRLETTKQVPSYFEQYIKPITCVEQDEEDQQPIKSKL